MLDRPLSAGLDDARRIRPGQPTSPSAGVLSWLDRESLDLKGSYRTPPLLF
jgi:hypothetical protein